MIDIDHGHPNFPPSLSITPSNKLALEGGIGDTFGVEAQRAAISRYGIAGRVWEAAYTLCAYVVNDSDSLLEFDPPFVDDARTPIGVVELGSGTGVVAARARSVARCGGFVIATDLPDVCPLLEHNLGITASSPPDPVMFVRPLAWGLLDHATAIAREFGLVNPFASCRLTHILCSDLVYFPELLGPLIRTLIHLTSPCCTSSSGPPVKIVISYKVRSLPKETPFWAALGLWFSFQPVLARHRVRSMEGERTPLSNSWRQFGADDDTDRTFIFIAYRRPESITWHVPDTDKELMEGVGARGTWAKKGDDTFETILFMAMGIDDPNE